MSDHDNTAAKADVVARVRDRYARAPAASGETVLELGYGIDVLPATRRVGIAPRPGPA
ncbi:hypothetical protein [Yinghuangia soli]|uniref:Uncharacterized protein n=1 Tax=Yinghuangia soli TaxID=2908204 RepID=A0AA41Q4L3_9ACTN|nr:hypothetical protein [Yinghuangia soli]MCF2531453.1 hypothetical protein [Yinghuangia soli]